MVHDVRRIAFVSERFLELQGLIPAAFGGALLLAAVMQQALGGDRPGGATQMMMFAILAGSMPATVFLQRSYKRAFGDVVATGRQKFVAALQTMLVQVGATIDMLRAFDGHPTGPSFAALALVAYSIAIVVRDWPWRSHHIIAAGAGLAGAYATASLGVPAYLLAFTLIGFALVVTGLFDHHLLASVLRPGAGAGCHDVPSSRRSIAVVRTCVAVMLWLSAGLSLQFEPRWIGITFPMTLAMALFGGYFVMAVVQTARGFRDFPNVRRPAAPELRVDLPASVAIGTLATAAAVQAALLMDRPPVLFIGAVAAACLWLALTNWRERREYLLVSIAALAAMPFMLRADPARGFIVSVFAIAAAFVLHGLAAWRRSLLSEISHADTF
jgi:hypothetical protein